MITDWREEYIQQINDCETDKRASLLTAWEAWTNQAIEKLLWDTGRKVA